MLKLNTPKYVLFKENTLDKMIPKKKNLIYLNNKLMRILNKQKKGFSTTSMIKPTKNLDNVDNNKQYTKISFQSTISQNDLTLKKFSKFKIRKVLNNNISNVNLEQDERQQKLLKHRKNKSNIQP